MTLTPVDRPAGPPTHPDGTPFRFEMLYSGLTRRAYAETHTDLIEFLIVGYASMSEQERWHARLAYMVRAQVITQAALNTADSFMRLSNADRAVLQGPRHDPPVVATWDCPVPLILIATYYEPAGKAPRPVSEQGMEPNVIWVDPSDDITFLESLHDIAAISLHEAI